MNKLSGPLPDLSNLKDLRNVVFDGQGINGTLATLAGLARLHTVDGASNALTGEVPAGLCGIKKCDLGADPLIPSRNKVHVPGATGLLQRGRVPACGSRRGAAGRGAAGAGGRAR